MVLNQCQMTKNILTCSYDGKSKYLAKHAIGHIKVVRLVESAENKLKFEEVNSIEHLIEDNCYRYIRHAVIRGNIIAFISELGHHENKLVIMELKDEHENYTIIKEISG